MENYGRPRSPTPSYLAVRIGSVVRVGILMDQDEITTVKTKMEVLMDGRDLQLESSSPNRHEPTTPGLLILCLSALSSCTCYHVTLAYFGPRRKGV